MAKTKIMSGFVALKSSSSVDVYLALFILGVTPLDAINLNYHLVRSQQCNI
jgi:hypothetical protein